PAGAARVASASLGLSGAWLGTLATNLAILLCGLVSGILSARLLAPEGRGALAAVLFWPHLITSLGLCSLPAAVIFRRVRAPADPGRLPALHLPRRHPARPRSGRRALWPLQPHAPAAVGGVPGRFAGPVGAGCSERRDGGVGELARHRAHRRAAPAPVPRCAL